MQLNSRYMHTFILFMREYIRWQEQWGITTMGQWHTSELSSYFTIFNTSYMYHKFDVTENLLFASKSPQDCHADSFYCWARQIRKAAAGSLASCMRNMRCPMLLAEALLSGWLWSRYVPVPVDRKVLWIARPQLQPPGHLLCWQVDTTNPQGAAWNHRRNAKWVMEKKTVRFILLTHPKIYVSFCTLIARL
jgi:hypothetical protein